ncbi:MAG: TIGR03905 family TSCPD domain-containing protein [Clostridia bacterium]|nr:TIGR03905 family TSCPD domain-containing protein [Clostridia bacterium]
MIYKFKPEGVCSREMEVDIEDGIIKEAKIVGGCPGNTVGVSRLVVGMKIEDAIKILKGIPCGIRGTSCPDQFARGLEKIKEEMAG